MKMKNKEKIDYFKKEVFRFIDFFGLIDWEVYVFEQDKREDSLASCRWHGISPELNGEGNGKNASICFGIKWIKDPQTTKLELSKSAFHEVTELLLANLSDYSNNNSIIISQREIENEIHSIIRRLENRVFPLIK